MEIRPSTGASGGTGGTPQNTKSPPCSGLLTRVHTDYDRVTVYCPQAVNWMLTVVVRTPRTTTATNVPESNRGAVVQLVL